MARFGNTGSVHLGAAFAGVEATREQVESTEFEDCTFIDCNFTEAQFRNCRISQCSFERCNLSLAEFPGTRLLDVSFTGCKLAGIDWTRAAWSSLQLPAPIRFEHCIVTDSSFFGLNLDDLVMTHCRAQDVDFREGAFCNADFRDTDLSRSLFNRTKLSGANFAGAHGYRIDIFHNDIRAATFSRDEAIGLLETLDIVLVD